MNDLSSALRITSSGLSANRTWMNVVSNNLANANSVRTETTTPWRRQDVEMQGGPDGVKVVAIVQDMRPLSTKYDPSSKFRDKDGNVEASNVEPLVEMVNMIAASRSYEANVEAFNTVKGMIKSALNIGKV